MDELQAIVRLSVCLAVCLIGGIIIVLLVALIVRAYGPFIARIHLFHQSHPSHKIQIKETLPDLGEIEGEINFRFLPGTRWIKNKWLDAWVKEAFSVWFGENGSWRILRSLSSISKDLSLFPTLEDQLEARLEESLEEKLKEGKRLNSLFRHVHIELVDAAHIYCPLEGDKILAHGLAFSNSGLIMLTTRTSIYRIFKKKEDAKQQIRIILIHELSHLFANAYKVERKDHHAAFILAGIPTVEERIPQF